MLHVSNHVRGGGAMGDLSPGDSNIFYYYYLINLIICSIVPLCSYVLCLAAARLGVVPRVGYADSLCGVAYISDLVVFPKNLSRRKTMNGV